LDAIASIAQIFLINFVLSGDNALVIAMAARHLPPPERRAAMIWGSGMAIGLRLILTLMVSYVLLVPGLRFAGAVLLLWIAYKLLQEETPTADQTAPALTSVRTAVVRIVIADLVMSLDNVVAVAGVSRSDPVQLTVGLILSITMILACSQVIVEVMNRFRWVAYVGAGVLALTATGMMRHDMESVSLLSSMSLNPVRIPLWADWAFRGGITGACLTFGLWRPRHPRGRADLVGKEQSFEMLGSGTMAARPIGGTSLGS